MNRTRKLIPTVLVSLAVVVALVGPANISQAAGSLTVQQVKGIAKGVAKGVVKQRAKKLSVKNSANLGGLPPSAYQDNAQYFTSNIGSAVSSATLTLPLAPGKYLVSWSTYMTLSAATGRAGCWIYDDNGPAATSYSGDDINDPGTVNAGYSGTGLVTVAAGDVIQLYCSFSGGTFTTSSNDPIQVVAVPLDTVSATPLVATRPGTSARP